MSGCEMVLIHVHPHITALYPPMLVLAVHLQSFLPGIALTQVYRHIIPFLFNLFGVLAARGPPHAP